MASLVIAAALVLAAVHLAVGRVPVRVLSPGRWSSAAGGVAVAYVFVHIMPALAERQSLVADHPVRVVHHEYSVYLMALVGFVAFYEVERLSREDDADRDGGHGRTFWLHVGSFGLYDALIGYLLHGRLVAGVENFLLFVFAMGVHLAVIEYGLQHHHSGTYEGLGQVLLAAAVLAGAAIGYVVDVGPVIRSALFAALAGAMVLNAVREDLPEGEQAQFSTFALGAGAFAIVLVIA